MASDMPLLYRRAPVIAGDFRSVLLAAGRYKYRVHAIPTEEPTLLLAARGGHPSPPLPRSGPAALQGRGEPGGKREPSWSGPDGKRGGAREPPGPLRVRGGARGGGAHPLHPPSG